MAIRIERLTRMEDFKELPAIQQSAWGFSELDLEPHQLMTRVQKYGGLVMGLFVDGRLVGFSYALIGKWQGEYFMYSHMAAVRREHQRRGYGFLIKKAQRDEVLNMGYRVIRWNYDPLEATNSFFNVHRLGVVVREYERDIYGHGESGLHQGLPTDRLIATWELDSERVRQCLEQKRPPLVVDPALVRPDEITGATPVYIEIPRDVRGLKQHSLAEAEAWRLRTRALFEEAFARAYEAREVVFSPDDRRLFYRLDKP